jgi:ribosomal protein S26
MGIHIITKTGPFIVHCTIFAKFVSIKSYEAERPSKLILS